MPKNLDADVAIIDMAYDAVLDSAPLLTENLSKKVQEYLASGKRVILPVQAFGRGVEILYLLYKTCPGCKIWLVPNMKAITDGVLNGLSVKEERKQELAEIYDDVKRNSIDDADIVIIGDAHLERPENQATVRALLGRATGIIGTGRRKAGSFMAPLSPPLQPKRCPLSVRVQPFQDGTAVPFQCKRNLEFLMG